MGVQGALFLKNTLKSLGLKVKLAILASIDSGGAVDIGNNWSVGGRIHYMEVKQHFLQELKEAGIIEFQWVSRVNNEADMFTKKLTGPEHNKHAAKLCRHDEYCGTAQDRESHEQGRVSGVMEHLQLKKHKSSVSAPGIK